MARNSIETQYDNNPPWHNLGATITKAKTVEQMMALAKINWHVKKQSLAFKDGDDYNDFDRHYAIVRSSDKRVLSVVGNTYIPTPHQDVFKFAQEFVTKGKANLETMGSLNKGAIVWCMAKLNMDFTLPGRDKVQGYLFLGVPYMRGRSIIARITTVRDACNNTISIALRTKANMGLGNVFRMNHRNVFDEKQITRARETLDLARHEVEEFGKQAIRLQKLKMTPNDTIKILQPIFQPRTNANVLIADPDEINTKLKAILDANKNAPGAQPDNAWGVLNAVTYWADHIASKSDDKRLTNAWMGRTANQKQLVLESLMERI